MAMHAELKSAGKAGKQETGGRSTGPKNNTSNPGRRLLKLLDPSLIIGAADDDPTELAKYAQAGAQTGYRLLWTCLLTVPMMMAVQYTAAKVAVVHGKGLTDVLEERYPTALASGAVLALLIANLINAGSDIGAIGAAFSLVLPT